jgi:hypothetical protein
MYTRNVRIKLKANGAPEFTRKQVGFQDEMLFVAPQRNEAIAISFWDKRVNAEAYNHIAYLDVLRILSKVVEGMPVVETFEVANSTSHEIAAGAV